LAHHVLENYIRKIDYVKLVDNCYDAVSTINLLNKENVDALLLDIQMPDLNGLELIEVLEKNCPKVIFTTAYTEFALQSFNYEQVIDYLHKPIRINRFIKSMERLKKQLILEQEFDQDDSIHKEQTSLEADYVMIKNNKVLHKIRFAEIQFIQSWGNYLKIFIEDDKMQIARKTIKEMEVALPRHSFERIHKSYIVNISKVQAIDGRQIVLNNMRLPIGKSYFINARKRLMG